MLNPWPIIGGVATSLVTKDEFISPDGAVEGDVVVVTKPMGTQVLWAQPVRRLTYSCVGRCESVAVVQETKCPLEADSNCGRYGPREGKLAFSVLGLSV